MFTGYVTFASCLMIYPLSITNKPEVLHLHNFLESRWQSHAKHSFSQKLCSLYHNADVHYLEFVLSRIRPIRDRIHVKQRLIRWNNHLRTPPLERKPFHHLRHHQCHRDAVALAQRLATQWSWMDFHALRRRRGFWEAYFLIVSWDSYVC